MIWTQAQSESTLWNRDALLDVYCRGLDGQMTEPTPKDSVILGVCARSCQALEV